MNNYEKSAIDSRNKYSDAISKKIKQSYKRVYLDYEKRLAQADCDMLTEQYLRETAKYLRNEYKKLGAQEEKEVRKAIENTINSYTQNQADLYSSLCPELSTSFTDLFSKINEKALYQVVSGEMYKDKISLSERLWANNKTTRNSINQILTDGLVAKKGSIEIAKDLEAFVNPNYKREYERFTIHPKSKNKVEFNSYRLANTYINHAYQTATKESAKHNPFVKTLTWLSGTDKRVCELCISRDGKKFKKNEIPLDHPLGRCTLITDVGDLDNIARELKDWVNGGKNEKLDNWFANYGVDVKKNTSNNAKSKSDNKNKISSNTSKPIINKKASWSEIEYKANKFKNKSEIITFLSDNYGIKFSDSKKSPIDEKLFGECVNFIDKFNKTFDGFNKKNPVKLPIIKVKANSTMKGAIGYYSSYTNKPEAVELALNGRYHGDTALFKEYLSRAKKSKWTVKNAKEVKTFVHEYGHHVSNSMRWITDDPNWEHNFVQECLKEYNGKNRMYQAHNVKNILSEYAQSSESELFAEAFAEYFGGKKPREFATLFGEKLEKVLQEVK